jgi:hypothetical protein
MKGTLIAKQRTYTAVSQLTFKGVSSKSITSTLCASPTNRVHVAVIGQ